MDDDIRSRFRGGMKSSRPQRTFPQYLRPDRPKPKPANTEPPRINKPSPPPPVKRRPETSIKRAKPKRSRKKLKAFFIIFFLLLAAGGGGYGFYKYKQQQDAKKQAATVNQAAEELGEIKPTGTLRLIAIGDNLTFDSVNSAAKKSDGSYDYASQFAQIKPFFDKADVKVCNETVPAAGTVAGITGFPSFNAPPQFSKGLADLGCNVINLGTDHINDKGQAGIDPTVAYWDNQSAVLAIAGANRNDEEKNRIRYFEEKNVKFAFLSYTTRSNNTQTTAHGVNMYSDEFAKKQIEEARKNAQMVIVGMTWGNENSADITADQDRIAQFLTDLNVDIILGGGPNVIQPAKILSGKDKHQTLVWFSLGNFLNSQIPIENLIGGIAIMDINIADQHITNPSFLPVYMHYEWTADQRRREDVAARTNLGLYPLDLATDLLPKSQHNTTIQAQTDRVKAILTKFAPIKIIDSGQY